MERIILFVLVLVGSLLMDLLAARWTQSVVSGKRAKASLWTGLYYTINTGVVVVFVGDCQLIPASVLGHMLGTFLAVKPCPRCW